MWGWMQGAARRKYLMVAAAGVVLALAAAALHLPPVRAQVLRSATAWLHARGLTLEADRLDYNVFTLSVALVAPRVSATSSTTPFFEAEHVLVDLPTAVLRGRLVFDQIILTRPLLRLRSADGRWNLPQGSAEASPGPPPHLDIRRLLVSDLRLDVDAPPVSIDAAAVQLDLRPSSTSDGARGNLNVTSGIAIQVDGRRTTASVVDGTLEFDGRMLRLDPLTVRADEGQLWMKGQLGPLLRDPLFEMAIEGFVDLAAAARWLPADTTMTGRAWVAGTLAGPVGAPRTTLTVVAPRATYEGYDISGLRAQVSISPDEVQLSNATAILADGRVSTSGRIALGSTASSPSTLEATMAGVDLHHLLTQGGVPERPRIGSRATGSAKLSWQRFVPAEVTLAADIRLAAASDPAAIPLEGSLRIDSRDREPWRVSATFVSGESSLTGEVGVERNADSFATMPVDGVLRARIPDVHALLARLDQSGLAVPSNLRSQLVGGVQSEGRLSGVLGRPQFDSQLVGTSVGLDGLVTPGTLEGQLMLSADLLRLTSLRFQAGANAVSGDVVLDFANDRLSGVLALEAPELATVSPALAPDWRVAGSGRASTTLAGTPSDPQLSTSLTADRLEAFGQPAATIEAAARITARGVDFERFVARNSASGVLEATGRLSFADEAFALALTSRDWTLADLRIGSDTTPLRGTLAVTATLGGTIARPTGTATLSTSELAVQDLVLGETRLDVDADGAQLQVEGQVPALRTSLQGTLEPRPPYAFSMDWSQADVPLQSVFDAAGALVTRPEGLTGRFTSAGQVAGTLEKLDASRWNATVTALEGSIDDLPFSLDGRFVAEGDASYVQLAPVSLRVGQTSLSLVGRLDATRATEGLTLGIDGPVEDLAALVRAHPSRPAVSAFGRFGANLQLRGTLERPEVASGAISVADARVVWAELPAVTGLTIDARVVAGEASLDVSRAEASWQDARLDATGTLPLSLLHDFVPDRLRPSLGAAGRSFSARGTIANVGPSTLAPFLSADQLAQVKGEIDGRFTLGGSTLALADVSGELLLDRAAISLVNVPLEQTEPTRLRLAGSQVTVERWQWRGADNLLEVAGGFSLAGERPVSLKMRTLVDLRAARAFVPTLDAGGFLTASVDVGGNATTPSVTGAAYVTDAMLLVRDPRLAVYDISATMNFAGTRLEIADAYGWANGGLVTISGSATYPNRAEARAEVRLTGNEIALEFPAGVRSLVAPDLRLVWRNDEPAVEGRVAISGGTYRSALNLTSDLLSRSSQAAQAAGADSALSRMRLDIVVVTTDDIAVDNNYGRLEIGADLRVAGTAASPSVLGRLTFREGGEIYLGGNTYHLEEGAIDFSNPARIEPDVSLTARTQVGSHSVTLTVTGTPDAIDPRLTSDEGYTEDQLLALLLTGQPDSTNLTSDINGDEMLGLLSGELSGFFSRTFGVRGLRVERGLGSTGSVFDLIANDVDPTTRLTLSQEFSEYVEVVVSQNLRKTGALTWLFIVKPRAQLDLRFTSRDDSSRAVEIRQELNFGGVHAERRPARRQATSDVRVAAVRISGTPGFSDAELLEELSLEQGSPFSFFAWQDDRDRLQRYYTSRGYFEARVVATRRPADGDATQVTLDYQITRGPLCELEVTGIELDRQSSASLLGQWTSTSLDAFLIEDLSRALRSQLSDRGYLRPTVSAQVQHPTQDRKVMHLTVEPGPHSARTEVVFVGNQQVETWELERWMYQQGLYLAPWTDQASFSSSLEGWYRNRGHLVGRVRVDPPTFDDVGTTVTVRIAEGPQFAIGDVRLTGVSGRPLETVSAELSLSAGSPYTPSRVEQARSAVMRGYRADGFKDVRDTVTYSVDQDMAQVDVSLAIEEGPRQVIANVVVDSQGITHRGLIARALQLEPGKAVDLSAWQQARRRLYELGTFRSVRIEPVATGAVDQTAGPSTALDTAQAVTARVSLEEWPLYRVLYGLQVSSELALSTDDRDTRPALLTEFQRRNLFGRALTTGVAGRWQSGRRIGRAFLSSPRLFGLSVQSSLILSRSREDLFAAEDTSPYFTDKTGVAFEQRFQPRRTVDVAYSYRFERNHTRTSDPTLTDFDPIDVARYNAAVVFDSRDSFGDPRQGLFHSSNLEYASTRVGSDVAFVKYLLQQYAYPRLGPITLAGAFRLGLARGLGRNDDLIPSERFRTGGGNSVRGYGQDSLGPRDFFGDPAGGRGLLVLNGEARFPIYRWLRGVSFVDAGNVFKSANEMSLTDLAVGAGFGFRLETPAALIRVDYGVPTSTRFGPRRGRWYFSVGQIF